MEVKKFHDCVTKEFKKVNLDATFEITKNSENKYDIVFSMVMFRLNVPYKKEDEYKNGIKEIIKCVPKIVKNSALRFYYDDSLFHKDNSWQELFNLLMDTPCVELIKYDFKQFKETPIFHDKLFGTFVRFLPLFNFYKTKTIAVVIDIDIAKNAEQRICGILEHVPIVKSKRVIIFNAYNIFSQFIDHSRLQISQLIKKYNFMPRIIAQPIISSCQLDKKFIINFLHCMFVKCSEYTKWFEETVERMDCDNPSSDKIQHTCNAKLKLKKSKAGIFIYGIDEFFINYHLLGDLFSNQINFYINLQLPLMYEFNYFLYDYLFQKKYISNNFIKIFQQAILKDKYTDDIKKNHHSIDKILYMKYASEKTLNQKKKNPLFITYSRCIYEFLRENCQNGELMKNIKDKSKKFRSYYNLYFGILTQSKFDSFIQPKKVYKIVYKKGIPEYTLI